MKPEVSIVIPSLGHFMNIDTMLESISHQTIDLNRVEVILAFNGKMSENLKLQFTELLKKYNFQLKFLFIDKKGVNLARNQGLKNANAEIVIFFDDDCVIQDLKFIQKHLDFHGSHLKVFALGGGYLLSNESKFFDSLYNYIQMKWLFSGILGPFKNGFHLTRYLIGGNFSIKKEFTVKNNLSFDESIIYGGSEYEFFRNADRAQMSMVLCGFDIVHSTNEGLNRLTHKLYKQGQGKAYIDKKYGAISDLQPPQYKESFSFLEKKFMLYFNYVFWLGYYSRKRSLFGFSSHLLKDLIGFINSIRSSFIAKLTQQINSKKQDGDRF